MNSDAKDYVVSSRNVLRLVSFITVVWSRYAKKLRDEIKQRLQRRPNSGGSKEGARGARASRILGEKKKKKSREGKQQKNASPPISSRSGSTTAKDRLESLKVR